LLQYSNIEASQFIEEELLKNPLLAHADISTDQGPIAEAPTLAPLPESFDAASFAASGILPGGNEAPLDIDTTNSYDAGTNSDGGGSYQGHGEDDDGWSLIDSLAERKPNLREQLEQQARLAFKTQLERVIATALIARLDAAGRLAETPEAIAATLNIPFERLEAVRQIMLRFEPTGIFARDLRECLAVQLAEKNRLDPAMATLLDHLELLARRDLKILMERCGVDAADLADMISEIKRLDPKPGAQYDIEPIRPLIPDVLMRPMPKTVQGEHEWMLEINPETMPRLLIRRGFHAKMVTSASRETKSFLSEQLQGATWLVKALESRAQTILRVSA
ncbi:MAG: RNA polymerase factor sigma-54, partial [Acidocella sp. 21-58-7]